MRDDFVESHRGRWPVRLMLRVLRVWPGGSYDWRGRRQNAATRGSGRRHQDDSRRGEGPLRESAGPRRAGGSRESVLREYRGSADASGGDRRQDEAEVPRHDRLEPRPPRGRERVGSSVRAGGSESGLDGRHHLCCDRRGLAVPGGSEGSPFAEDRGLVDVRADRQPAGRRCLGDGRLASSAGRGAGRPLGPRQPVCQRARSEAAGRPRDHLQA